MNTPRIYLPAAIVALLFIAAACGSPENSPEQSGPVASVEIEEARLQPLESARRFAGTVVSDRTVHLSTKVMGRISELSAEQGDYLAKGEVVVRIKDDNLKAQKSQVEANLRQARAELENVRKNYERFKALKEQESVTQKEFDDISTQYEGARAGVQALEARLAEINDLLAYTVLRAPFNGYVVAKNASEGDMAAPGQPLVSFEQEKDMKVQVTVPETEISLFSTGDTVSVKVNAAGLEGALGVVSNVNPSGNRGSRQFMVEVKVPELPAEAGLKSGMYAEVSRITDRASAVLIPKSAIIERGQLTGIYTLNDRSELLLRWVRLGSANGSLVQVLSGLSPGESYVKSVEPSLREGQKVSTL